MKRSRRFLILCIALAALSVPAPVQAQNPLVRMETSQGIIAMELFPDKAPETVKNFLAYAGEGFYDGTVFHRVIKGFMIQGGGMTADMKAKPGRPAVVNEAGNGLKNQRGTVAMARTRDPHSATSQFFINTVDNAFLDHRDPSIQGWGYCVFGKVVEGMDVVDRIAELPTQVHAGHRDVPVTPVVIGKVAVQAGP